MSRPTSRRYFSNSRAMGVFRFLLVMLVLSTANAIQAATPPHRMLWAWEEPEDLRFLRSTDTGVAFLAASLLLRNDSVLVRFRRQPLLTNPGTFRMAVVRIETDRKTRPRLSPAQSRKVEEIVLHVVSITGVSALQIDFDATQSEWRFYRTLLAEMRSQLSTNVYISITALTSWCTSQSWLPGIAADEVVPMLFRMGPDREEVLSRVNHQGDFVVPQCRTSLGLSTDEPKIMIGKDRRLYYFAPRLWNAAAYNRILTDP